MFLTDLPVRRFVCLTGISTKTEKLKTLPKDRLAFHSSNQPPPDFASIHFIRTSKFLKNIVFYETTQLLNIIVK